MEDLYGMQSSCSAHDYSMHEPDDMVAPSPYNLECFTSPVPSFPVFGSSEQMFSCSSVSDSASPVAEIQKSGMLQEEVSSTIRTKIASHPLYPKLLEAYIDCQKVGAPPQIASLLDEIRRENELSNKLNADASCLGADPELDEFMELYCQILAKHKLDLSRPFNEATTFLNDIEAQLNTLCKGSSSSHVSDETLDWSDEGTTGGVRDSLHAKGDRELREKLLHKYSGYISTLKQEFSKKKKNGKLPKEARQLLLNWWNIHYKWPYPTEADKLALADVTGLDQKQINNWFINQRKRHWKPSENTQLPAMDNPYWPSFMND
ncbi:hypothetical protein K2173_022732 [Erythroxylum novogranatense]|uniref:Homeobox protein knotted-1-like 6 n=1 Tax=Erythroxylum novogranatense TaxID=1862640 RepID=A0AAV8SMK6_9ROSI|nr:hypothetical protein K2173_022732 [Erythroxylum novogranatense]